VQGGASVIENREDAGYERVRPDMR
jgi:hypothetical protein